jgi:hypothetical protein
VPAGFGRHSGVPAAELHSPSHLGVGRIEAWASGDQPRNDRVRDGVFVGVSPGEGFFVVYNERRDSVTGGLIDGGFAVKVTNMSRLGGSPPAVSPVGCAGTPRRSRSLIPGEAHTASSML